MKKNTVPALSDDEFVELEDLLAGLPEDCGAMSSDEADGYLTGLLLSPEEILPERWMPWIVSAARKGASECRRGHSLPARIASLYPL